MLHKDHAYCTPHRFYLENGYLYDMVLVLPKVSFVEAPPNLEGLAFSGHDIIQLLHMAGLQVHAGGRRGLYVCMHVCRLVVVVMW